MNIRVPVLLASLSMAGVSLAQSPYGTSVISYSPGLGADGYENPTRALGEPTRFYGAGGDYPSVTSPFSPAWEPTDVVSIGTGGALVVAFDHPVTDDPANPFGIDLLVFGNSFYGFRPDGLAGPLSSESGLIEVSADGITWKLVSLAADGAFPTMGYSDVLDPYSPVPGLVNSDFTKPVNPGLNFEGLDYASIVAGYGGSGGGAGVDLASVGLASINFVRISNPADATLIPEIDGFADVAAIPAPGTLAALALLIPLSRWRRR